MPALIKKLGRWAIGALLVALALVFSVYEQDGGSALWGDRGAGVSTPAPSPAAAVGNDNRAAEAAFAARQSDLIMTVEGTVVHLLADDNDGSRHQRFLIELPSGLTLKISHNIDLAPRVERLRKSSPVRVHGEYEWNDKGGVIHWTHHDPKGWREGGWIEYDGRRYE